MYSRYNSHGTKLGQQRYGNETRESLDFDHMIEPRITKEEARESIQQAGTTSQRTPMPVSPIDSPIMNPGKVDEAKWSEAKKAAEKSGYKDKYAVVTSIYKKMGGTFHKA